jgi:hypothetical protein
MELTIEHRKPGRPPGPRKELIVVDKLTDEQIEDLRLLATQPHLISFFKDNAESLGKVCGLLAGLLSATRVRAIAGYKRDRCLACDHPHTVIPCKCVHHAAEEFLKARGFELVS